MKRQNQKQPKDAPRQSASAHAESLGDFAQARKLSLQEGGHGAQRLEAHARFARLGTDPLAWRIGLGALCAYMAVWFYALTANR